MVSIGGVFFVPPFVFVCCSVPMNVYAILRNITLITDVKIEFPASMECV